MFVPENGQSWQRVGCLLQSLTKCRWPIAISITKKILRSQSAIKRSPITHALDLCDDFIVVHCLFQGPGRAILVSANAVATDWNIFENDSDEDEEARDARDEERIIDHSAPINVDAMNTDYVNKSNEVWDGIEQDRWIYNLDGDVGILPNFKKKKAKIVEMEYNEDDQ